MIKNKKYLAFISALVFIAGCTTGETEEAQQSNGVPDITESAQTISVDQNDGAFTYYDLDVQGDLQAQVEGLKEEGYSADQPLFILNPYGTINNGLYTYFTDDEVENVEYTIEVEDDEIPTFTQRAVNYEEEGDGFEFLLFGLVPGEENYVELSYLDDNDSELANFEFLLTLESTKPDDLSNQIEIVEDNAPEEQTEELFTLLGSNGDASEFTYIFDNEGVIRAEIQGDNSRQDNIHQINENEFLLDVGDSKIARMNGLSRVEEVYDFEGYTTHHDFILTEENGALVLVNEDGADTVEDIILYIDLETGEYYELIDLKDHFPGFLDTIEFHNDEEEDPDQLDWTHINSIHLTNEDEIVLSAREMSTVIKMSDIFEEPQVDYLIGMEEIWQGTGYEDLLLEPENDFPFHAGQHTVQFVEDEELADGEYYLILFNNNFSVIYSRPDFDQEQFPDISHHDRDPNEDYNSYYYKYLINENEGTVDLVDQFEVPYSSIVSNVQHVGGNIVVNSGMANMVGEYDAEGNLLRQYEYKTEEWTYRVIKRDYSGIFYQ